MSEKLDWLLKEAASQFRESRRPLECFTFTLGKMPSGWRFQVVDSWSRWMDAGLKHEFGLYESPEQAVRAFLDYVAANKVECHRLQDR